MVILLPLMRRMPRRTRLITGAACLVIGAVAVLCSRPLGIPGIVSAVVGVVFLLGGVTNRPKAAAAARPGGRRVPIGG